MADYGTQNLLDEESKAPSTTANTSSMVSTDARSEWDETQEEEFQENVSKLNQRTRKLVVPVFLTFGAASLLLMILGCASIWDDEANIAILVSLTFGCSLLGAYGVYKWGTIMMEIDRLSGENRKYEAEIGLMNTTVNNLKQNVSGLQENVNSMKRETDDLNKALHEFDDLRKDLKEVAGQNEDILEIVNGLNNVYTEMAQIIIENEKSALYEIYYDVELRDKKHGLSKREWDRMMGRLSEEQRDRISRVGTFEEISGRDNKVDFLEFQSLIQKVLDSYAEEIIRKESAKMSQ